MSRLVNRRLYRVCTGPLTTCVRTLAQFSCTKSHIALDSSSLAACSTGGASTGSSLSLATVLRRFGAGPGCGGPPHCTVLLCRSRSRSLVNDLRHTSQTKGVGLQPLVCRCKLGQRVNARPHVAHLCIVADTRRDPTTARCVSGGRLLLVDWHGDRWRHRIMPPDCTSAKWHLTPDNEPRQTCFC